MSYTQTNKVLHLLICIGLGEYLNEFKNVFDSSVKYILYLCLTNPKASEIVKR